MRRIPFAAAGAAAVVLAATAAAQPQPLPAPPLLQPPAVVPGQMPGAPPGVVIVRQQQFPPGYPGYTALPPEPPIVLTPAGQAVMATFDAAMAAAKKEAAAAVAAAGDKAAVVLQKIQDDLCREAKLDEAVAVRELIRGVKAGKSPARPDDLPPAAAAALDTYATAQVAARTAAAKAARAATAAAAADLQKLVVEYCQAVKLDEAVAARDQIRRLKTHGVAPRPDPGMFDAPQTAIGQVYYFDIVARQAGPVYGTEVYTTQSHLGTAAIHSGALKPGERGVVKVTVLPGQAAYPGGVRNGVQSTQWQQWHTSFSVEKYDPLTDPADDPKPADPRK